MLSDTEFRTILESATSIQLEYIRVRISGYFNATDTCKRLKIHRTTPHKWGNLEGLEKVVKTIQIRQIEMLCNYTPSFIREREKKDWIQNAQQVLADILTEERDKEKSGFIYIVKDMGSNYYKIGMSRDPNRRLERISPALPFKTLLVCLFQVGDRCAAELFLHQRFGQKRVNGEWFELSEEDIEWIKTWGDEQKRWIEAKYFSQLELI